METIVVGRDTKTIQAALSLVHDAPAEILIEPGVYHERLQIFGEHIRLIGLGEVRIVAGVYAKQRDAEGQLLNTFRTATVLVNGMDIELVNLTIENDAGPGHVVGQAVAFFGMGQKVRLRHCRLLGNQDTVCLGPLPPFQKDGHSPFVTDPLWRQYPQQDYHFSDCEIAGTVDFIFGGGQAIFENCLLRPLAVDGMAYLTAASTAPDASGFVFRHCAVIAEGGASYKLGRPWRKHAKTRFEACWFGYGLADGAWQQWTNTPNLHSVTYEEIDCLDEEPDVSRVEWSKQE